MFAIWLLGCHLFDSGEITTTCEETAFGCDAVADDSGLTGDDTGADDTAGSVDADGDGVSAATDCDDSDASVGGPEPLYVDGDGDGYGDPSSLGDACPGDGYTDVSDDCDDTSATVNPDQTEICDDGLDNDCDGTSNDCALSGSYPAGDADMVIRGTDASDYLGYAVAAIGDTDDDGVPEIAVGAPNHDKNVYSDGLVSIVSGDTLGEVSVDDLRGAAIAGVEDYAYVGSALSATGDVTGDGIDDLLVGAYGVSTYQSYGGAAYLFAGPVDGGADTDSAYQAFYGPFTSSYAGFSVAASADFHADGAMGLLVGTPYLYGGRIYRLSRVVGTEAETSLASADAIIQSEGSNDYLSYTLNAPGDLNGDGVEDLFVSALYGGEDYEGAAYVALGPIDGEYKLADAELRLYGDPDSSSQGGGLGSDAAIVGDLNGDGYNDYAVSGTSYSPTVTTEYAGVVYVFHGPVQGAETLDDAQARIVGAQASTNLGHRVAGGDTDGDGVASLVVTATGYVNASDYTGGAFVFEHPTGALTSDHADAALLGEESSDQMGTDLAVGDVNGDGYDDLIAGARYSDAGGVATYAGSAYVLFGQGF